MVRTDRYMAAPAIEILRLAGMRPRLRMTPIVRRGNREDVSMPVDSCFEHHDERFNVCVKGSARVEKLAEGCRWAEGPAYFPAGRYVIWSDIPNDRIMNCLLYTSDAA